MNKHQQIVVLIGVVLVVLSSLFPPYEGELRMEGDNLKNYLGYRFLFTPPSQADVFQALLGRSPNSNSRLSICSSHIITSRLWVQIATIVIATAGVALVLGQKNRKGPSKNNMQTDIQ
ncbi:MAG: hypothetical protein ABIG44_18160 [Planctomycetota bacterium]